MVGPFPCGRGKNSKRCSRRLGRSFGHRRSALLRMAIGRRSRIASGWPAPASFRHAFKDNLVNIPLGPGPSPGPEFPALIKSAVSDTLVPRAARNTQTVTNLPCAKQSFWFVFGGLDHVFFLSGAGAHEGFREVSVRGGHDVLIFFWGELTGVKLTW